MTETRLAESLTALMGSRRSMRRFRPEPIPGVVVRRILSAACLAPSLHNSEPMVSYSRITGAPVVIVASLTMEGTDAYPDERRAEAERQMAVQSVAMAGYGLLLAAHAGGVG